MIKIAIRKRIINHNPFAGYSVESRPKASQKYIPANDLKKLKTTPLNNAALDVTRDMFLFSCYTGLSHIDLYNLTYRQIEKDDDGYMWLKISRQKTENEANVFLLDEALRLIEKYRETASGDRVFPMKSWGVMNRQLKKIAKLCGIERRLTSHMARHTFATETCLSQGISIESVSSMMGHKFLETTEIYAKTTPDKMGDDMKALSKTLKGMYMLVS
jgi:integrase